MTLIQSGYLISGSGQVRGNLTHSEPLQSIKMQIISNEIKQVMRNMGTNIGKNLSQIFEIITFSYFLLYITSRNTQVFRIFVLICVVFLKKMVVVFQLRMEFEPEERSKCDCCKGCRGPCKASCDVNVCAYIWSHLNCLIECCCHIFCHFLCHCCDCNCGDCVPDNQDLIGLR